MSAGSGRSTGNARRRRRSEGPVGDRSTAVTGGMDAWQDYLNRQRGRQVESELPGPVVTSVRTEAVLSPTQHMERGETQIPSIGAQAQQTAQMPTGSGEHVPVNGSRRTPGSAGTFSSMSTPDREPNVVAAGQGQGQGQNGQVTLEAQLLQIAQTLTALQSQVSASHRSLESRLEAVEAGRSNLANVSEQLGLLQSQIPQRPVFGTEYRGNGATDFRRIGSPIRNVTGGNFSPVVRDRREPERNEERDVFSKSEKWLPAPPEPRAEKWSDRESEITGFYSYAQALRAWSQLGSNRMAVEIQQAIAWPHEIVTATLTEGQKSRSARLFALLKVAFASHPRVDSLIRAYEAGCPIHNSPAKPFGSCGYELLKILALEFSLKTRTEAICLRAELLRRDFRVDSKSSHVVSDLIRMVQVAVNRYNQLIETLPTSVPKH